MSPGTAKGRWHIASYTEDQVLYSGTVYAVVNPAGATVKEFTYLGLFGARVWGLLHFHGWLPVS